jgi:hypothetical protein
MGWMKLMIKVNSSSFIIGRAKRLFDLFTGMMGRRCDTRHAHTFGYLGCFFLVYYHGVEGAGRFSLFIIIIIISLALSFCLALLGDMDIFSLPKCL